MTDKKERLSEISTEIRDLEMKINDLKIDEMDLWSTKCSICDREILREEGHYYKLTEESTPGWMTTDYSIDDVCKDCKEKIFNQ